MLITPEEVLTVEPDLHRRHLTELLEDHDVWCRHWPSGRLDHPAIRRVTFHPLLKSQRLKGLRVDNASHVSQQSRDHSSDR
jgi:hypothetical protein